MDLDQLKQKITKSAEIAEHYFQERVAAKVEPKLPKQGMEENKASDPAILFQVEAKAAQVKADDFFDSISSSCIK